MSYSYTINPPNVQQGWQCPICKRVYSPYTMMCLYCRGEKTEWTPDITVETVPLKKDIESLFTDDMMSGLRLYP